jgi:hypothetical protein
MMNISNITEQNENYFYSKINTTYNITKDKENKYYDFHYLLFFLFIIIFMFMFCGNNKIITKKENSTQVERGFNNEIN